VKARRPPRRAGTLRWAHDYRDNRGWAPVPLGRRSKKPRLKHWQEKRLTEAQVSRQFLPNSNIGLSLGDLSHGLTDIDIDAAEGLSIAADFFPPTDMRHGRPGKPGSHWWYVCDPLPKTEPFRDVDGSMLVEIRATGALTMVPPSVHPNGEVLSWEGYGEPAPVPGPTLRAAVARLAACVLVARHWPETGSRHDCALALSGFLLRLGLADADVTAMVGAVARVAGDEEAQDRVTSAAGTALAQAAGDATTGGPTLARLLRGDGPEVVKRLTQWLRIGAAGSSNLPAIDARNQHLPTIANKAWSALDASNHPPSHFTYGNQLVRLRHPSGGAPTIDPLSRDALRHRLARTAFWYRPVDEERVPALPPMHVVRDMLVEPEPRLPVLERLVEFPTFEADGTLNLTPGFHAATGTYFAPPAGFTLPSVPETPTDEDVRRARQLILEELLFDFPFVEDADRAHAVQALILPVARRLIAGPTPLVLVEKPSPGTGGTLLAEVIALPALGHPPAVMTEAGDEDEWRKRITAKVLRSPAVILLDNLRERLRSAALAAALTSTIWEDRILRESRIVRVPIHALWVATGNNPALSDEIARRTIRVRLDAQMERPSERSDFRHPDLKGWAMKHRADLLWAVAVMVRAWLAAGRPPGDRSMGTFESWAMVMGGILGVAGIPGLLENQRRFVEQSTPDTRLWGLVFERWARQFGSRSVSASDVYALIRDEGLPLELRGRDEHAQRTSLGMTLRQQRDRQYGSYRLESAGERQGAQRWRLIEVTRRSTRSGRA
jgi:hypothetical protein